MAKEVKIQATLTCQRFAPALLCGAGNLEVDQASTNKRSSTQFQTLSGTSETEVSFGTVPLATLGFVFIKNLNTDAKTVTVLVATGGGPTYAPFAKLSAGQFCLIPVNAIITTNSLYVKASAASVDLLVVVAEN